MLCRINLRPCLLNVSCLVLLVVVRDWFIEVSPQIYITCACPGTTTLAAPNDMKMANLAHPSIDRQIHILPSFGRSYLGFSCDILVRRAVVADARWVVHTEQRTEEKCKPCIFALPVGKSYLAKMERIEIALDARNCGETGVRKHYIRL